MRWRALFLVAVIIGLAPGTWLRSPLKKPDYDAPLMIADINVPAQKLGEVQLLGAWHLTSKNSHFGGYSALLAMDDGSLLAGSDSGRMLRFAKPGVAGLAPVFGWYCGRGNQDKHEVDLEALTRDPASGTIWAGYEGTNSIERADQDLQNRKRIAPPEMRDWSGNSGPEALTRLADGRFVVLAERGADSVSGGHEGLIFAGDPVEGAAAKRFGFATPDGYSPVDMATLPDGRVLILIRAVEWAIPPGFKAALIVADPADIVERRLWEGRVIAHLAAPAPSDNYEGLAVAPNADGTVTLWVISDDNNALFQKTFLLKLGWDPSRSGTPTQKARENPARLSNSSY